MSIELENFFIKFQEKNDHDKPVVLHTFVQSFSQTTKEDAELKKAMFLNLIAKVPDLFAILTNFKNAANSLDTTGFNERDLKSSNLQGAILYLETLLICFNQSETSEQLPSLFCTTITVLYQSYTHCKESEVLYGDLLEDFTDQLANFLNKIQIVQAAMLSGLNQLITLELSDSQVSAVVGVSEDLGNLCNLVTSLDKMLAVKLWRIFIKIVTKYPELSRETITVDPIISSLVSQIIEIVDEYKFKLENKESVEESEIKLFLFFTNLVMKVYHIFHSSANKSLQTILTLALKLSNLLILFYSPMMSDEINQSQLKNAVRNTVKSMFPLFYSDSTFLNAVLQSGNKELSPDLHMAHVLMKSSALDYMLYTKNYMKEGNNEDIFIKAINVLQTNSPEEDIRLTAIRIPNSIFQYSESGRESSEELVTFYQHVHIRFSKYSKIISDSGFEKIESHMLKLLVSSSELVSLLVSDIWIYRLRCSSTEYLHTRIKNLMSSFSQFRSNFRYKYLLQRMIKFLPTDVLIRLFAEHGELRLLIRNPNKVPHRYSIPDLTGLQTYRKDCKILKMITLLINELKSPVLENPQLISKACCLLELFSLFVNVSQNSEIIRLAELANYLFKTEIYEVQIAVLTFLKAFSGKIFNERDVEFKKVGNVLATLLADTLHSRNYFVKYEAFYTYASLAQSPSLGYICRQTLVIAPNLALEIKSYFSKVPLNGFLTEKERMKNLQKLPHCQPERVSKDIKKLLPLKSI